MIVGDVIFDLLEVREALKDAILKHSMELMLDAGEDGILLKDIKSELVELRLPVKRVEVQKLETMNHLAHSCLNLGFVKEGLVGQQSVFPGQLLRYRIKPWVGSFESIVQRVRCHKTGVMTYLRG